MFSGCSCRIITQVTLESCRRVTRPPFHTTIRRRFSDRNLQFVWPSQKQNRFIDSRTSTSESQACSLLLPPGKWLGPYLVPRPTERTSATTGMRRTAKRAKRRVQKQEHLQYRRRQSHFAAGTLHRNRTGHVGFGISMCFSV